MNSINPQRIFSSVLELLEETFRDLETKVPPPKRKPWKDGFVLRYSEQTVQQAIVQKLARIISGLHAVVILTSEGLYQEQCVLQRVLDEIEEDVSFLSFGIIKGEMTERHRQYLEHFYAEEFDDPTNVVGSHSSRGMVPRAKIRAYINEFVDADVSRANAVEKVLAKAYSGFVHAASPHIMDMCGGEPPRFDVGGEFSFLRSGDHARDAMNYFFRALASFSLAAKAFGDEDLFLKMRRASDDFQNLMPAH